MQSEWDIIKQIKNLVGDKSLDQKICGIGDDCAVYTISSNRYGLFSADISIEDVHFDLSYTSYFDAGYRSMSANISDIFAMGGVPILALISLGLATHTTEESIKELYDGLLASSSKFGLFIAGGDISKSEKLTISISIYGESSTPIFRKGANIGDYIYVTGDLGLSKLGLEILQSKKEGNFSKAIKKHLRPDPRGDLIKTILDDFSPTAMIDISDGLLSDLGHICEESNVGFELKAKSIPIDKEIINFCGNNFNKMLDYSLYSGEEYELIFTSARASDKYKDITCIGRIIKNGYFLDDGIERKNIKIAGYDHFK